jgi:hypothetical protein
VIARVMRRQGSDINGEFLKRRRLPEILNHPRRKFHYRLPPVKPAASG